MTFYLWLAAGAAAGGFINGLAGFGSALFALTFWLQILSPVEAVSLIVIVAVASGLQGVALVRQSIFAYPVRLARFVIPALLGIPLGTAMLATLSPAVIKMTVGCSMLLYGALFAARKSMPKLSPKPLIDCLVGFFGGILGGAASLSGVLPTMWCALQPWTKSEQRAVMQPFNVIVLAISAVIFAARGYYSVHTLPLVAIALPTTLVFAQIGIWVFKRIEDDQFRRLLVVLMLFSGAMIVCKEIFVP